MCLFFCFIFYGVTREAFHNSFAICLRYWYWINAIEIKVHVETITFMTQHLDFLRILNNI